MRRALLVLALTAGAVGVPAAVAQAVPFTTWSCNGSPCVGWFNRDVRLLWDIKSGEIVGPTCVNTVIVNETPKEGIQRMCVLRDADGEVPFTATIRLDKTPPVVLDAVPERPPDNAGWYTRPVAFVPQGADALSGLARCDAPTYGGPDTANALVLATCRDVAGNTASRAFPLRYDATAPDTSGVAISTGDRVVRLTWPAGATATLVRTPGGRRSASAVMYQGQGTGFADRGVRNNRQYRYVLTLTDAAGNAASREFVVTPRRQLLAPGKRAVVKGPPLLRWTPVRGARYYNVQVFRGKRKVLSAWPRRAALQLKQRWRYRGHRYRLREGRYRWYVWPGVGPRAANRYGERIGARTFVVDRGAGPAA